MSVNNIIADLINEYDFSKIGLYEPDKYTRQQLIQILIGSTSHKWPEDIMNPEYPALKMETINMVYEILMVDEAALNTPLFSKEEVTEIRDWLKRMPNDSSYNSISDFPGITGVMKIIKETLHRIDELLNEDELLNKPDQIQLMNTITAKMHLSIIDIVSVWMDSSYGGIARSIILLHKLYFSICKSWYALPDDENLAILKNKIVTYAIEKYENHLPVTYQEHDLYITTPRILMENGKRIYEICLKYTDVMGDDIFKFKFEYPLVINIGDTNTSSV